MWLVGFKGEQRKKQFSQSGAAVRLNDCQIKPLKEGHELEVMLKNSTYMIQFQLGFLMPAFVP